MDAGGIAALVTAIIALIGVVITWRKSKPESRVMDGDAAERYQRIASQSAKREIELMAKIDTLEKRVDELEAQLDTAILKADKFEEWARRLVHQVKSLGYDPVPLEPAKKEQE